MFTSQVQMRLIMESSNELSILNKIKGVRIILQRKLVNRFNWEFWIFRNRRWRRNNWCMQERDYWSSTNVSERVAFGNGLGNLSSKNNTLRGSVHLRGCSDSKPLYADTFTPGVFEARSSEESREERKLRINLVYYRQATLCNSFSTRGSV